jgi:TatD DNase family protein
MEASMAHETQGEQAPDDRVSTIHDTHCHLGMYRDPQGVLERAIKSAVKVVSSTARPSEYRDSTTLRMQPSVTVGIGFHPEYAGSVYVTHEQAIFDDEIEHAPWVNEVGLDAVIANSISPHFGGLPTMEAQIGLFEFVLERTRAGQPLSVHSRGSAETTLDLLDQHDARRVVLHFFDGHRDQATRALAMGYYFSLNPALMSDPAARELMAWLPAERLLLETDGPYFSIADRAREPGDLRLFVTDLAELRMADPAHLSEQIATNFSRLLND